MIVLLKKMLNFFWEMGKKVADFLPGSWKAGVCFWFKYLVIK